LIPHTGLLPGMHPQDLARPAAILYSGMAMKIRVSFLQRSFSALSLLAFVGICSLQASSPQNTVRATPRVAGEITSASMVQIPGSVRPQAQAQYDTGRLPSTTKLEGMTITFSRSPKQEADLENLMAGQQNPSSPQYHKWLTPEQFAARYGMADADLAAVQTWLEQQGFAVDSVARSKTFVRFSGTVGQAEAAFATEIHTYAIPGATGTEKHFAPSKPVSVPAAMARVVENVRNLDDFKPRPHFVLGKNARVESNFTSSLSGSVYFAPGDIATVYDISPSYSAGNTGVGQNIVVVGQSAIVTSDIEAFQTASGLTVKDPSIVLVPGSGTSTIVGGDETESDLDLEWSGAIAKGATITFIYTGNSSNSNGVWDSISYAVDQQIGTIISSSYGLCEAELGGFTLESTFQQAMTQGQTVLSASGDSGATDCFTGVTGGNNPSQTIQQTNSVDYPASSPYVTGVGGTEISQADSNYETPGAGYWANATSSDVISSALQYIPEQAWNEDTANCGQSDCLFASGGGASTLFSKPTWQTGVPGIPTNSKRDVPDVALNASTGNPGYLLCTSDTSAWQGSQQASCNSGFRDAASGDLTIAGGTSFAAPIFAGMVAIINQQQNYASGQGLVNSTLYKLASDATTYAAAFHDITTGNNSCPSGTDECSTAVTGFTAGTGYDQVTGLGSVDLGSLVTAWPASTSTLISTTTTIAASNTAPVVGSNVSFAISVASATGSTVPSGSVKISVDGATGTTLTLNSGAASYTTSFSTAGGHTITADYTGDTTHAASSGSVTVTASAVSSGKGTFTVAATNMTVTDGSVGTSTITVTPSGGYTGTIQFSVTGSSSTLNALANTCLNLTNAAVTGASAVTQTFTIDTNAANCAATGSVRKNRQKIIAASGWTGGWTGGRTSGPLAAGLVFGILLLAGVMGKSSRKLRHHLGWIAGVFVLATAGLVFTGCGGSGSNTPSNPAKGTYTLTLSGTDTTTSTITAMTTFTLTIQ
jgi:hypothetical protein